MDNVNPNQPQTTANKRNRGFVFVQIVFSIIFIGMIVYFSVFQITKKETYITNTHNPRLDLYAEHVQRGNIMSADGKVLATTKLTSGKNESRYYPYAALFSHAVGFASNGKSGIENQFNFSLLESHTNPFSQAINAVKNKKNPGDTVVTTLDTSIQQRASDALGDRNGAVVVLEVKTGKIIAMVSKPVFNPNTIESKWNSIVKDKESSVLLNRATQGLYPPGSIFKVITTLEYMKEYPKEYKNFSIDCKGSLTVNDAKIHNYGYEAHGREDLESAFAHSCNVSFATIGLKLHPKKYTALANKLFFNTNLPTSLQTAKSKFSLSSNDSTARIMQTAIGQGTTMVSPIHMAMIAACVDNDGVVMKPYIVNKITSVSGTTVKNFHSDKYGSVISRSDAEYLQTLMKGVVTKGTGSKLNNQSYTAYGKTGSAEYNEKGDSHGWFIGFGKKKGYSDIAIAVIVEKGNSGSQSAVPIAKQVFDRYFNSKN